MTTAVYSISTDNRLLKTSPLGTTVSNYVEVINEPNHKTVLLTSHLRVLSICFGPGHTPTEWHRHSQDSLYMFLTALPSGAIYSQDKVQPKPVTTPPFLAGFAYYIPHSTKEFIHQVCNCSNTASFACLDIEIYSPPPSKRVGCVVLPPLDLPNHEAISFAVPPLGPDLVDVPIEARVRLYKLELGERKHQSEFIWTNEVQYNFHGVLISLEAMCVELKTKVATGVEGKLSEPAVTSYQLERGSVIAVKPGWYSYRVFHRTNGDEKLDEQDNHRDLDSEGLADHKLFLVEIL